jgi:hypothetical protein
MIALTGIMLSSTVLGANASLVQAAGTSSETPLKVTNALKGVATATPNKAVAEDDAVTPTDVTAPSVTFANGETTETMNFNGTKLPDNIDTLIKDTSTFNVTKITGSDSDVSYNKSSNNDIDTAGGTVTFTPVQDGKDGSPITRTVVIYQAPDWSSIGTRKLQINDKDGLAQPFIVKGTTSGQNFMVTTDPKSVDITKAGNNTAKYTATALDANNNVAKDTSGNPITFSGTGDVTVSDSTDDVSYNVSVVDKRTGNPIPATVTKTDTAVTDGAEFTVKLTDDAAKEYTLPDDDTTVKVYKDNPTKVITLAKNVPYSVKFADSATGDQIGDTISGTGLEGSPVLTQAPDGYKLVNSSDMIYTIDSEKPTKTISVTKSDITKNLGYTVQFRDRTNGDLIKTTTGTGNFNDYVTLAAPDGYAFSNNLLYSGFLLYKDGQTFTSYVTKADTPYTISYYDQANNKLVGTQSGTSADGATVTLTAPKGYTLVNANDVNYTINKDAPNATIFVKKSDDSNVEDSDIVATYPDKGKYVKIYDANGDLNDRAVLSAGSSWIIDQTKEINGVEYYRVATNEYIKASDAYKYTPLQSVVTTTNGDVKPVYNSKGQLIIDVALDHSTPWYTDRSATINGEKMYRVATDQWVRASDVTEANL